MNDAVAVTVEQRPCVRCKRLLSVEKSAEGAIYHRKCRRQHRQAKRFKHPPFALRWLAFQVTYRSEFHSLLDNNPALVEAVKAARRRQKKNSFKKPYGQFLTAVVQSIPVEEMPEHQDQARGLVADGWCAYENRRGFIRNVGPPVRETDAGRIWSRKPEAELSDPKPREPA